LTGGANLGYNAAMPRPTFSLIVPTRRRPDRLRQMLDSVARTARRPDDIEIILVIDADDPDSAAVSHERLSVRHVVGPHGRTMGALNETGYDASAGSYVMLLNDDVVARTPGWDATALRCCRRFADGIALVHVNDTLSTHHLCTFPLVSRTFCELAGGICPREYLRYRIDDHIEDVFNVLAFLGRRRTVYLPDVVFEHFNAVEDPAAGRVCVPDPDILALDGPRFLALFGERKELALRLLDYMENGTPPGVMAERRRRLEELSDPFALRVVGRQHVERALWRRLAAVCERLGGCYARGGCGGVARAALRAAAKPGRLSPHMPSCR
jgi:glycosyltransferase involved in cell wall biosynthesis